MIIALPADYASDRLVIASRIFSATAYYIERRDMEVFLPSNCNGFTTQQNYLSWKTFTDAEGSTGMAYYKITWN